MSNSHLKIFSTKRLNEVQLSELPMLSEVTHLDILETSPIPVDISGISNNIIFTSYKAAEYGLRLLGEEASQKSFFCVGLKTNNLLRKLKYSVVRNETYSKDLAKFIIDNFSNKSFSYLCNDNRLDILPELLKASNVECKEFITYQSKIADFSNSLVEENDIYLWFSPMGVKSMASRVSREGVSHFAIGETTAKELIKENIKSEQISFPTIPSVDGMIEMINNRYK